MINFIKKNYSIFLSCVFVYFAFTFFKIDNFSIVFKKIRVLDCFISICFALTIYIVTGFQYKRILLRENIHFSNSDVVVFPILTNLWSLLIPFQGSLIFSTIFFNLKFNKNIKSSLSISIFLYSLTISFTGLVGFFVFLSNNLNLFVLSLCILLAFFPFYFFIFHYLSTFFLKYNSGKILNKFFSFIDSITSSILIMYKDVNLLIELVLLKLVQTFLIGLWYWIISINLGFNISLIVLLLLSLISELSLIIKITPDNIGVNQILSGMFLIVLGLSPQSGVLISFVASATSIFLIMTIGLIGNYYFLKKHKFSSIKSMISQFISN